MPSPIEDYALLADTQTGALVSKAGSIDWLCVPRFDSAAPFAALLGDEGNGRWQIAPSAHAQSTRRGTAATRSCSKRIRHWILRPFWRGAWGRTPAAKREMATHRGVQQSHRSASCWQPRCRRLA